MMSRRIVRPAAWLAAVALSSIALAACGSSDDNKTSSGSSVAAGVSKDATIAAQVPAAIKSKGTLTVATDATYPPNEFIKPGSKQVVGMDADLAKALGQVMGLKVNVVNATFESIIPGLAAKKYDLGMASFTDTREREKVVDFVTYFSAGTSFYAKQGGATLTGGLAGLCGKTVAAEKGTTQVDDATAQGKKCKAQGKGGVQVLVFPDQNGVNLAISSGRAQIGMADSPVVDYLVKKQANGQFKLVGTPYGPYPYGIAMNKSTGLTKPVLAALKKLIAGGQYQKILQTWAIQSGAISNPAINGATS